RFSVADVVDHSVAMVRERAVRHGIQLRSETSPDVGDVEADVLRCKQVLLNLLSNAVKFTPDGGNVTVRTTREGDQVVVLVIDSGVGIAAADRERIFESFQQGTRSPASQEGTGLGLTLCRRIVELHGGRLWVESELGAGSTFGFALPATAPETREQAGEAPPVRARPLVLLVEDDQSSLDLLHAYLENSGFDVAVARDGAAGLGIVRRDRPDAVVLDIRLPGLIGWDVLAAMQADPATAAIPVIVASVLDERAKGLSLGAAAYLVKPISRDDLIDALSQVVDGTRLASTSGPNP
ncbi:MAG: ATP-binding response regulator, partial [Actinomycetes bacterium]